MGLADLKNTCVSSAKRKIITLDEFIDGAELYAKGLPEITSQHTKKKLQPISDFKACTFTLTKLTRDELAVHAHELGVSKSKLIRIMSHNLNAMGELERKLIVKLYSQD